MMTSYGPQNFASDLNVSRETMGGFETYADLLLKWQKRINLIGPQSADEMWRRHFLDSGQLIEWIPKDIHHWLDIGSGAGFPGLVMALLLKDRPDITFHLVESNTKKASFLREAARLIDAPVHIHHMRIEAIPPFPVDVVSARACASLPQLLEWTSPFVTGHTLALFPKGQDVEKELTSTSKCWNMKIEKIPSKSDPTGVILRLKDISRV